MRRLAHLGALLGLACVLAACGGTVDAASLERSLERDTKAAWTCRDGGAEWDFHCTGAGSDGFEAKRGFDIEGGEIARLSGATSPDRALDATVGRFTPDEAEAWFESSTEVERILVDDALTQTKIDQLLANAPERLTPAVPAVRASAGHMRDLSTLIAKLPATSDDATRVKTQLTAALGEFITGNERLAIALEANDPATTAAVLAELAPADRDLAVSFHQSLLLAGRVPVLPPRSAIDIDRIERLVSRAHRLDMQFLRALEARDGQAIVRLAKSARQQFRKAARLAKANQLRAFPAYASRAEAVAEAYLLAADGYSTYLRAFQTGDMDLIRAGDFERTWGLAVGDANVDTLAVTLAPPSLASGR